MRPAPFWACAEAAKDVVLAEKPTISGAQDSTDPALLEELLRELGTLASVYHKPAASFVSKMRLAVHRADDLAAAAVRGSQNGEPGASEHYACSGATYLSACRSAFNHKPFRAYRDDICGCGRGVTGRLCSYSNSSTRCYARLAGRPLGCPSTCRSNVRCECLQCQVTGKRNVPA